MPFVFSMTWRAHGINDPDYLPSFHPSKALGWGWVCELSLCRSLKGLECGDGAVERRELLSLGPSGQTTASSAGFCAAQRPFRSRCWYGRQMPYTSSFGRRGIVIGWDRELHSQFSFPSSDLCSNPPCKHCQALKPLNTMGCCSSVPCIADGWFYFQYLVMKM